MFITNACSGYINIRRIGFIVHLVSHHHTSISHFHPYMTVRSRRPWNLTHNVFELVRARTRRATGLNTRGRGFQVMSFISENSEHLRSRQSFQVDVSIGEMKPSYMTETFTVVLLLVVKHVCSSKKKQHKRNLIGRYSY